MNFYNIIQNILGTSSKHKNVKEVSEGDIYVYLNSGEHKYPCVFLTVGEVTDSEMSRNVNCTLFYVDRLSSDQSNRTVVQSLGITTLGDILDTIEGDVVSVNYTTFTEKFADMCAGVFATVDITYPLDEVCDEHFEVRRLEITENGIYDTIGYDEFVIEVVDEELVERVEELEERVSKKEEQINSVTSISITENGTYTPEEGVLGWNNINVNVTSASEVWKVPNGTKLTNSTWSQVPNEYDFSNITDFKYMFQSCTNLTSIPQIDTSNGTDFYSMFASCKKITTIPLINTSKGTNFYYMFNGCTNLTSIPQIDTSKGTDFRYMFQSCTNLTSIPQLDMSRGTEFFRMFEDCTNLTSIPQLDMSNGTNFYSMFEDCINLTTISQLDTSKGTNFYDMFWNCGKLTTISQIDVSKGTNLGSMFHKCTSLENITFVRSINANVDFSPCTLLTYDSVKSILTACSNTTKPTTSKTLKFNRTLTDQNGELAALVATCNSKGWTISGLTLN